MPNLGAVVHLGDVWHAKPSEDDLEAVAEFFQRIAERAPLIALLGNHGAAGYSLLMRRLKARYAITVVDGPQVLAVPLATGSTLSLAAIPYPQKGVLVAQGVAPGDIKPTAEQALDIICMDLAAQLQQASGQKMLIGHATITGAIASSGQPMGIEHEVTITAAMLARFGAIPKVFGHIHKPQALHGAIYAGSTSATDYGETEAKRYLVVEFDDDNGRIVSHPLDTPKLFHVEADLSRAGLIWLVTKGPDGPQEEPPPSWDGCDLRVRVRYPLREREQLVEQLGSIKARFAGARRIEVEPIAVPDRALRAPEVVEAKTIDEKLRAWARLSGASWSEQISRCAAQLQTDLAQETLVAEVERRLGPLADLAQEIKHDETFTTT